MSADTLAERIREIKEREAKATKGGWSPSIHPYIAGSTGEGENFSGGDWMIYPPLGESGPVAIFSSQENVLFAAHARADVPYLLEQLEKALSELSAAEQAATVVEVAHVDIPRAPERWDVLVNGKRVWYFGYEHQASEMAEMLKRAIRNRE